VPVAAVGVINLFRQSVPWQDRFTWEKAWLVGAALSGLVGSAVGAGEGAAAYRSRRPPGEQWDDPERDDYRDGPGGCAAEPPRAPDCGDGQ
jgi:hypothetical protein